MRVRCFDCAEVIEAGDTEGVVAAFVAHGREVHAWSAPEAALRNYVCNYADALERLGGDTERLPAIGPITVHEATAERVADWLRLFDRDGFADNPDWASCYCLTPHVPATPELPERPWREMRATMIERLHTGATFGYLAYVDDRPAGWVNASLRSEYGLFRRVDVGGVEPRSAIGIACYVIAPPFRRHGVAAALLDRVIADAATRGAAWIEAYPHNAPQAGDAPHFRGPRSMYEARGFQAIEVARDYTVMRRALA